MHKIIIIKYESHMIYTKRMCLAYNINKLQYDINSSLRNIAYCQLCKHHGMSDFLNRSVRVSGTGYAFLFMSVYETSLRSGNK